MADRLPSDRPADEPPSVVAARQLAEEAKGRPRWSRAGSEALARALRRTGARRPTA